MKRGIDTFQKSLHNYVVKSCARSTPELEALQKVPFPMTPLNMAIAKSYAKILGWHHFYKEPPGLLNESLTHEWGRMTSPPDSVAILQLMTKLTNAKVAIEVGVFTGYTALGIALALPESGKLYALDINEEYVNIGKPYWQKAGVSEKIDLRIGEAKDSLANILKEVGPNSADLAFIDADKPGYDHYYEMMLKILRPGGVIIIDNVLFGGTVFDESIEDSEHPSTAAIRVLNQKIATDKRVHPAMLKNSDGITIAYKL